MQIFDQFFVELTGIVNMWPNDRNHSNFASALEKLLRKIYIAEFSLINPLVNVNVMK
jgi:hypothetical protein